MAPLRPHFPTTNLSHSPLLTLLGGNSFRVMATAIQKGLEVVPKRGSGVAEGHF
jgi:hypothetical protein